MLEAVHRFHHATDASPTPSDRGGRSTAGHSATFRPDVQGLRAIAVTMVVIYHLYPTVLPGGFAGVDVFFAISGFLIIGHLGRSFERNGRVDLIDFWGRRARRLLPAAGLVLTVTWLVSLVVLPVTRLPAAAEQVRASALYYQNWVLAHDAVSYLTADDAPSPVQHFWSLSVEEQFYLFWPFVFVIAAVVGLRGGARAGRAAVLILTVVVVASSLTYSAHLTRTNPAAAYFVTTTRIWELALGGLLALLPRRLGGILARQGWLAWLGAGLVIASGFVISGTSAFPGTIALLPVGGAVLLIACGSRDGKLGPWRLTSVRPMVFIGDISYSLYLWHWPLIVLWKDYSGGGIGVLDGPAIAVAAVVLAWGTKVLVEDKVRMAPFIARHRGRSLATAVTVLVPVLLVACCYTPPGSGPSRLDAKHPGAAVLAGDVTHVPKAAVAPSLAAAPTDYAVASVDTCQTLPAATKPKSCTFGDVRDPTLTVALVGDSVAGQWSTALDEIGKKHHWKIVTDTHSGCPWTDTVTTQRGRKGAYTQCHDWGVTVLHDLLTRIHPDVVISSDRPTLGTPSHPKVNRATRAAIGDGMATYWTQLLRNHIGVIAMRESPEMGIDVPDCLSRRGTTVKSCSVAAAKAIVPDPPTVVAARKLGSKVALIDMNSLICGKTICAPVVGNVVVYRDRHHLTATYTRTLKPYFEKRLLATRAFGR